MNELRDEYRACLPLPERPEFARAKRRRATAQHDWPQYQNGGVAVHDGHTDLTSVVQVAPGLRHNQVTCHVNDESA